MQELVFTTIVFYQPLMITALTTITEVLLSHASLPMRRLEDILKPIQNLQLLAAKPAMMLSARKMIVHLLAMPKMNCGACITAI